MGSAGAFVVIQILVICSLYSFPPGVHLHFVSSQGVGFGECLVCRMRMDMCKIAVGVWHSSFLSWSDTRCVACLSEILESTGAHEVRRG